MSSGIAAGGFGPFAPQQPGPPVVWDQRRYIHFHGEAFGNTSFSLDIDVFAGDQPPTVTGGYAQWATVQRPLRRSLTVFTGYDPPTLQFTIRFIKFDSTGTWLTDNTNGLFVEEDIKTMEWYAGEGTTSGPPPLVYMSSYDNHGNSTPLIPLQYQTDSLNSPSFLSGGGVPTYPWVISALDWDTAPIRNADGWRIHQLATVTTQLYESLSGVTSSPRPTGFSVTSKTGADTPLKIARSVSSNNPPKLAFNIQHDPKNAALKLRSANQTIKHGKSVWVPNSTSG